MLHSYVPPFFGTGVNYEGSRWWLKKTWWTIWALIAVWATPTHMDWLFDVSWCYWFLLERRHRQFFLPLPFLPFVGLEDEGTRKSRTWRKRTWISTFGGSWKSHPSQTCWPELLVRIAGAQPAWGIANTVLYIAIRSSTHAHIIFARDEDACVLHKSMIFQCVCISLVDI